MTTAEAARDALETTDARLRSFQQAMEHAARSGAVDPEELGRFIDTVKAFVAGVNDRVLPGLDPDLAAEISRRLITVLTIETTGRSPLDAADASLNELEAIRHLLRDHLAERPEALRRSSSELIESLQRWLPTVSVAELAQLLGISVRQLQRRRHDDAPAGPREQIVARLIDILRRGWTDAGVVAWFSRPRADLDGARPLDVLDDPSREQDLVTAARAGRVQGGS